MFIPFYNVALEVDLAMGKVECQSKSVQPV